MSPFSALLVLLLETPWPHEIPIPAEDLVLTLPERCALEERRSEESTEVFRLSAGAHELHLRLHRLDPEDGDFEEPEDVLELWRNSQRTAHYPVCSRHVVEPWLARLADGARDQKVRYSPSETSLWRGSYGRTPLAAFHRADLLVDDRAAGRLLLLTGFGRRSPYALELTCHPVPDPALENLLESWFRRAIRYEGPLRDPRWSDDEIRELWHATAPDEVHRELRPPIRTRHFLLLTNTPHGPHHARRLEEAYREFRRRFPFEENEHRRLLPVVLLRTRREFEQARGGASHLRGYARDGLVVTWYGNGTDRVHRHELAHQLVHARLRLGSAAWWFQEGLAELFATRRYDLDPAARAVSRGQGQDLVDLLKTRSFREGLNTREELTERYLLCALFAEFLLEAPIFEPHRQDFLTRLGNAPCNAQRSLGELRSCLSDLYALGEQDLERAFVQYARTRR